MENSMGGSYNFWGFIAGVALTVAFVLGILGYTYYPGLIDGIGILMWLILPIAAIDITVGLVISISCLFKSTSITAS